jgi:RimJ/RimL family protein N-acetyltransferase
LIIRNVLPGDGVAMFEAKVESFEHLKRWMPWAKELGTAEDSEITAREAHAKFICREDAMMIGFDKDTGKAIVFTGLHRFNLDLRIFEIGFWVRSSTHNLGYASESTNALIRYAFGALNASKVTICHADGNHASARVIEKLGFEKEGVFKKDARLPDGTVTDHHWFARFDDKGLPALDVRWG